MAVKDAFLREVSFLKSLRSEFVVELIDYHEDPNGKAHCIVLEYGEKSLADYLKRGKTVVFVDDINDTGTTMRQISKECAKHNPDCLGGRAPRTAKFVAMTEKTDTTYITDARALRIDDPRWLVYPWEKD